MPLREFEIAPRKLQENWYEVVAQAEAEFLANSCGISTCTKCGDKSCNISTCGIKDLKWL
jgi:hypothetical protein